MMAEMKNTPERLDWRTIITSSDATPKYAIDALDAYFEPFAQPVRVEDIPMPVTENTKGQQAMNAGPLRMIDGRWVEGERKPRPCGCCGAGAVFYDHDNDRARIMSCDDCGAIEVITKGNGSSWWYHGSRQPHEWPANFLKNLTT